MDLGLLRDGEDRAWCTSTVAVLLAGHLAPLPVLDRHGSFKSSPSSVSLAFPNALFCGIWIGAAGSIRDLSYQPG